MPLKARPERLITWIGSVSVEDWERKGCILSRHNEFMHLMIHKEITLINTRIQEALYGNQTRTESVAEREPQVLE